MRNPNITYCLNDYIEAKWVLETIEFGHGEYTEQWAKKVVRWFKRLYALAKKWTKSTRNFGLAIKVIYQQLRYKSLNNLYRTYIEAHSITTSRPIDLYSAKFERPDLGLKMKIRKTKYRRGSY